MIGKWEVELIYYYSTIGFALFFEKEISICAFLFFLVCLFVWIVIGLFIAGDYDLGSE